jgi:hypothetical protein
LNTQRLVALPPRTKEPIMTRLDTIVYRERQARLRDAMFAAFIALAAVMSAVSIGGAIHTSPANVTLQR